QVVRPLLVELIGTTLFVLIGIWGASPVFDFVSIATIIITVTSINVARNSIMIPFNKAKINFP
ncbi:unnamed protein product, partial [Rotaria sp. Silwood2]